VRRRPVVAVLAAAAVLLGLLGGCIAPRTRWVSPVSGGAVNPSSGASASTSPAQWRPCPELAQSILHRTPANFSFACATIKVPQDWATATATGGASDGKTFDIALVRVRASAQVTAQRIGSVLVNPGGPGGSGIELAVGLSPSLSSSLTSRFDIVGFDPRGVGRSTEVQCFTPADLDGYFGLDPDPASQADFDAEAAVQLRMAQECGSKYGDSLRLFSTNQTARDMDAIRAAVGDTKLTYLGFSYGTLLGAVYAQLFPRNVRALVLDGAIDPTQTSTQSAEGQAKGFELAFNNFTAWCKANTSMCPIAPDPRGVVTAALASARTNPLPGTGSRKATTGWIFTGVVSSLYSQSSWPQLASALESLRNGNASKILVLADDYAQRDSTGGYTNLFDANSVVNCTDDDKTPTVQQLRTLQEQWRAKYPLFGSSLALNLICAQWPGKHDPYPTGAAVGAPPIVVVGTTGDPATPYEQTAALAKMLGVGTVLTWQGEGHTAYPQTKCVTDAVNSYLVDLTVPATGKTCPAR
jgi:pimeloyl-ACP methyl ester carboxylesterase